MTVIILGHCRNNLLAFLVLVSVTVFDSETTLKVKKKKTPIQAL